MPSAPACGCSQLLWRPRAREMEHGFFQARLRSSGDSSLHLTAVWPEYSQLSGSKKLLHCCLAPSITPNRAAIHPGRLIFVGYPHPSPGNLWDGLRLPIHHLPPPRGLNRMQVASVSCSSGDMEEAVHSPWLQAVPGKKQLSGQHSVLLQEQQHHCTVASWTGWGP